MHHKLIYMKEPTWCSLAVCLFATEIISLHVSDAFCVHLQEHLKTVEAPSGEWHETVWGIQQGVQGPEDGRKKRPKHVEKLFQLQINILPSCITLVLSYIYFLESSPRISCRRLFQHVSFPQTSLIPRVKPHNFKIIIKIKFCSVMFMYADGWSDNFPVIRSNLTSMEHRLRVHYPPLCTVWTTEKQTAPTCSQLRLFMMRYINFPFWSFARFLFLSFFFQCALTNWITMLTDLANWFWSPSCSYFTAQYSVYKSHKSPPVYWL